MFSLHGIAAITLIFGFSWAITRIVARIDAAPPMSSFIVSMPLASLIDRPPESNAMPLPVSAIGVGTSARRVYVSSIMRGGFTLPVPTPRMPPNPPSSSSVSLQTLHVRPTCFAIAWASRGDLRRAACRPRGCSRGRVPSDTASTRIAARLTAAFSGLASHRAGPTAVIRRRSLPSAFFVRYRSKR